MLNSDDIIKISPLEQKKRMPERKSVNVNVSETSYLLAYILEELKEIKGLLQEILNIAYRMVNRI